MPNCEVRQFPNFKFRPNESNLDVRFHQFPLDDECRWKWEEWVREVNGKDYFIGQRKGHFLCSAHFTRDCYMPSMRLRRNAIPSIALLSTEDAVKEDRPKSGRSKYPDKALLDVSNVAPITRLPQSKDRTITLLENVGNGGGNSNCETSVQRKKDRIAFVGDITVADLTSPERAERSLAIIKHKYKSMQAQIHSLQRELRRSKQRILFLESLKLEKTKREALTSKLSKLRQSLSVIDSLSREIAEEDIVTPEPTEVMDGYYGDAHEFA